MVPEDAFCRPECGQEAYYDANAHACKNWTVCARGYYVSANGTSTGDRQCVRCKQTETSTVENAAKCELWEDVCRRENKVFCDGESGQQCVTNCDNCQTHQGGPDPDKNTCTFAKTVDICMEENKKYCVATKRCEDKCTACLPPYTREPGSESFECLFQASESSCKLKQMVFCPTKQDSCAENCTQCPSIYKISPLPGKSICRRPQSESECQAMGQKLCPETTLCTNDCKTCSSYTAHPQDTYICLAPESEESCNATGKLLCPQTSLCVSKCNSCNNYQVTPAYGKCQETKNPFLCSEESKIFCPQYAAANANDCVHSCSVCEGYQRSPVLSDSEPTSNANSCQYNKHPSLCMEEGGFFCPEGATANAFDCVTQCTSCKGFAINPDKDSHECKEDKTPAMCGAEGKILCPSGAESNALACVSSCTDCGGFTVAPTLGDVKMCKETQTESSCTLKKMYFCPKEATTRAFDCVDSCALCVGRTDNPSGEETRVCKASGGDAILGCLSTSDSNTTAPVEVVPVVAGEKDSAEEIEARNMEAQAAALFALAARLEEEASKKTEEAEKKAYERALAEAKKTGKSVADVTALALEGAPQIVQFLRTGAKRMQLKWEPPVSPNAVNASGPYVLQWSEDAGFPPRKRKELLFDKKTLRADIDTYAWVCHDCPASATCSNGTWPRVKEGSWKIPWEKERKKGFISCPYKQLCTVNSSLPTCGWRNGTCGQCSPGSAGVMCAVCSEGYVFQPSMGTCLRCVNGKDASGFTYAAIIVPTLVAIGVAIVFQRATGDNSELDREVSDAHAEDTEGQLQSSIDAEAGASEHESVNLSQTLKILVSHCQVFGSLNVTFDIKWPTSFVNSLDFLKVVNVDLLQFFQPVSPCAFDMSFIRGFYTHMFFLPVSVLIVILVRYGMACVKRKRVHGILSRQSSRMILFFVFLLYPGLATRIFRVFACKNVGGRFFLEADYNVECFHGEHIGAVVAAVFFMLVYVVGVPIISAWVLYQAKDKLDDPKTLEQFGSLYHMYRRRHWYFESVEMIKKCFLAGALVLIAPGTPAQILIGFFVAFVFLLTVHGNKPFEDDSDNLMYTVTSTQFTLTLVFGLILRMDGGNMPKHEVDAIAFILIAMNTMVAIFTMYIAVQKSRDTVLKVFALACPCCHRRCIRGESKAKIHPEDDFQLPNRPPPPNTPPPLSQRPPPPKSPLPNKNDELRRAENAQLEAEKSAQLQREKEEAEKKLLEEEAHHQRLVEEELKQLEAERLRQEAEDEERIAAQLAEDEERIAAQLAEDEKRRQAEQEEAAREAAAAKEAAQLEAARLATELANANAAQIKASLEGKIQNLNETTVGLLEQEVLEVLKLERDDLQDVIKKAQMAIVECTNQLLKTLDNACKDKSNNDQYLSVQHALNDIQAAESSGYQFDEEASAAINAAKTLLARLEQSYKLRKLILGLDQKTIAEIKSFNKPLKVIENVMRACFLLLGNTKKELADWPKIVAFIGKTGKLSLKRRIGQFTTADLTDPVIANAKTLLADVDINAIEEVNKGVATFYGWACSCIMQVDESFQPSVKSA